MRPDPRGKIGLVVGATLGLLGGAVIAYAQNLYVEGNIGIGTETPAQKLDVIGGARFTGDLVVGGKLKGAAPAYAIQSYTANRQALTGVGWYDWVGTSITFSGDVGDVFQVEATGMFAPGNTGYNHDRFAAVSGATTIADGQPGGYYTVTESQSLRGLYQLTGTTATVKLQHYSSSSGGSLHTILAGMGGSASAPFSIRAIKLH